MILLCALLLPACGPLTASPGSAGNGSSTTANTTPAPPDAAASPDGTIAPTVSTDAAPSPPGSDERVPAPGQSGEQIMPNGLPALQPHGVDLQKLFAEPIQDPVERIKRVENAVVEMRRDFDAVMPSIVRLVAVEQDMQDLTKQLGTLLQNEPQAVAAAPGGAGGAGPLLSPPGTPVPVAPVLESPAPTPPPEPVVAAATPPAAAKKKAKSAATPAAEAPVTPAVTSTPNMATAAPVTLTAPPSPPEPPPAPAPAVSTPAPVPASASRDGKITGGGAVQVRDLRIGEHPNDTRLVLDVNKKSVYTADLDNDEHLLVVELPGTGWAGPKKGASPASPLIASWTVEPIENKGGSRLILTLKKDAKITKQSAIPASGGEPYKVVIDLAGGG